VAEETGTTLNYDTGYQTVSYPEGAVMKQFSIITPAIEADAIVVVSKAKTHMWTRMTGATKNLFGLIPGLEKPVFHFRFPGRVCLREDARRPQRVHEAPAPGHGRGHGDGGGRPPGGEARGRSGWSLPGATLRPLTRSSARLIGMDPLEVGTIQERGRPWPHRSATVRTVGDDPADSLLTSR